MVKLYLAVAVSTRRRRLPLHVLEAATGNIFAPMPDVWINSAHVYFAQGNFTLAAKMDCLRKFYFNTDSQVLLYLARTHYEAEQWQDCKKTLLRAIHLAPSNYSLRFSVGVVMKKFSASTLNKPKKTAEEVRSAISEVQTAVCVFSQLSPLHGFDEKKIDTHVEYCKDILDKAKIHREVAEREEQANKQRLELARQVTLAEEARHKAEEQRKLQMEKRKQEEELRRVRVLEENFQHVKICLETSTEFNEVGGYVGAQGSVDEAKRSTQAGWLFVWANLLM